jgi:hypothetical protein
VRIEAGSAVGHDSLPAPRLGSARFQARARVVAATSSTSKS